MAHVRIHKEEGKLSAFAYSPAHLNNGFIEGYCGISYKTIGITEEGALKELKDVISHDVMLLENLLQITKKLIEEVEKEKEKENNGA